MADHDATPSPQVLQIPAALTPILRRVALANYARTAELAFHAADGSVDAGTPWRDLGELSVCRVSLIDAEAALELVGDDVTVAEMQDVDLTGHNRALIYQLICDALDQVSYDFDGTPSEEQIIAAAAAIQGLRALLPPEPVTM